MIDVTEIQNILPHRYPFLLVDKIIDIEIGKRIVGIKNITINEPFFYGHFPGKPILPGVLLLEAMAQVGGVLAYKSEPVKTEGKLLYLISIDKVRFRKPVFPGDQLKLCLEVTKHRNTLWGMRGEGYVDGNLVAEAEFLATFGKE
jgi:3-hydroxyacyl-[acyl-carrier-protein] dehydratase